MHPSELTVIGETLTLTVNGGQSWKEDIKGGGRKKSRITEGVQKDQNFVSSLVS